MKKTLFAAIALASTLFASPAFAGWAAISLDESGAYGYSFNWQYEVQARDAARVSCLGAGGNNCSFITSNPDGWSFAAVRCQNMFMAASSGYGQQAAVSVAFKKLGTTGAGCQIIYTFGW